MDAFILFSPWLHVLSRNASDVAIGSPLLFDVRNGGSFQPANLLRPFRKGVTRMCDARHYQMNMH